MKLQHVLLVAVVLSASMAAALRQPYGPVLPTHPRHDGHVKTGGFYGGNFDAYYTGLRGGVNAQPRQDYRMRHDFSERYYPQGYNYESQHLRPRYHAPARVGGYWDTRYGRFDKGYGYRNADVI